MNQNAIQNEKLSAALRYQAMGLSIIPTSPEKIPLVEWKQFQSKSADAEQIIMWWTKWPDANPTLVTGKLSGIIALDLDKKHGRKSSEFDIPKTANAKSGNDGEHFYFKHPGTNVETRTAISGLGVDIRGDGGCIVLPPSINSTGGKYEWISPFEDGIADAPEWLLKGPDKKDKKWLAGSNGTSEGSRNETAASMAGKILSSCNSKLWDTIGLQQFQIWNSKNIPPLEDIELGTIWESIKSYHMEESSEKKVTTQADKLVNLVKENPEVTLFHSELDEPFICFPIQNHKEYWSCKDKRTKWWLAHEFWNLYQKSPNADAINNALTTLQGFATFDGKKFNLSNRTAFKDGDIFYCLSNDEWEAVHITQNGWSIVKEVPILFRRQTHQTSQVKPQNGGNIWNIFKYVNVKNEDHKILFLVWLISCFIPDFPHPILYIYGPQGSAKSTASRVTKKIIDPSKIETFEIPKDQKELVQKLSHHWGLMFDNISGISSNLSDILCRAVTGSGFSKRELYSDDSDIIYTFKRCISVNGVNLMAIKPDLLERSLLIELERVSKTERKNEQELMKAFDADLPGLLGAIMDAVVGALRLRFSVKLAETPRMADFALWGHAIADALGYGGDRFIESYFRNIELQNEEIVSQNFIATFVIDLIEEKSYWEGSASELLKMMELKFDDNRRIELPKTPQALSYQINILKTNLEEYGIIIERVGGQKRKIIIYRKGHNKGENTAPIAPPFSQGDFDEFNEFLNHENKSK